MISRIELASYLRDFTEGGDGYLLDDFLQSKNYPEELKPYVKKIFEIHESNSDDFYPIGLANPASKPHILALIEELESERL